MRAALVIAALFVAGTSCGLCGGFALIPEGGVSRDDRARFHLEKDTATSLATAAALQDGDDPVHNGIGALARVLLWLEHGADDDTRARAEKLVATASPIGKKTGEALYARALLARTGNTDPTLAADIASTAENAWTLLAKATLQNDDSDDSERTALLQRAMLQRGASVHASVRYADSVMAHDPPAGLGAARAALDRVAKESPGHAPAVIRSVVLAHIEDDVLPDAQRRKRPVSPEKKLAEQLADANDNERAVLSLASVVFALAKGDAPVAGEIDTVLTALPKRTMLATAALGAVVVAGDVDLADRVITAIGDTTDVELMALTSRARFLRAVPDVERKKAAAERKVSAAGFTLPFGALAFGEPQHGLPWRVQPSSSFFPERGYHALISEVSSSGKKERVTERLLAIEKTALATRAFASGDASAALKFVDEANKLLGGQDATTALLEAKIKARGDSAGAKIAVEVALASQPLDPAVLLEGAQIAAEAGHTATAKKALASFARLGLKSAQVPGLQALVEAKEGNLAGARKALAEAKRQGDDSSIAVLRASLLVTRAQNVKDTQTTAKTLFDRGDDGGGDDAIAVWIADADENVTRAETTLRAIRARSPQLGEAHFFYAKAIRFMPGRKKDAIAALNVAIAKLDKKHPLADDAKKTLAVLKKSR